MYVCDSWCLNYDNFMLCKRNLYRVCVCVWRGSIVYCVFVFITNELLSKMQAVESHCSKTCARVYKKNDYTIIYNDYGI